MMKRIFAFTVVVLLIICSSSFVFAEEMPAPPKVLKVVHPIYPREAKEQWIEGVVILKMDLSDKGETGQVDVIQSSGSSILDQAAIDAYKQWTFIPAIKDGKGCASRVQMTFKFRLEKPDDSM